MRSSSLPSLSPALTARLEARRADLEGKLGAPLDLAAFVSTLLDATEPVSRGAPAAPRRLVGGAPDGFVTVLFREAESGRLFRRTAKGVREVPRAEGLVMLREGSPSVYSAEALEAEAAASAAKARGARPPPRVERYIYLRAGGACETPGCGRRGSQLHHVIRRAERVDHRPGLVRLACEDCHGAFHAGLLEEGGGWVAPGRAPREGPVDRAVQGYRRRAAEGPWDRQGRPLGPGSW